MICYHAKRSISRQHMCSYFLTSNTLVRHYETVCMFLKLKSSLVIESKPRDVVYDSFS